jgi:signal transduction histidine kinase
VLSESLEKLEKVSFEMKDLVESLLKLSRDIVIDDMRYADLSFLVDDLIKEYERDHPDFEFIVVKKFDSKIRTSTKYLKMLLNIIIDNAIKYSTEKKKVEVIIDKGSLSVRDYGIGINNPEKIFDRFYREDETRNKNVPGFGIGLSIAKKIADALKIEIKVFNKGDGSEFLLKFGDKV